MQSSEPVLPVIKKQPLLSSLLLAFLAAMILANIGSKMLEPFLPLYLQSLDARVDQIGLFFTLSSIIPLALQILGGWISDTLGRMRAIAIGSSFGVIGYIALVAAPSWQWLLVFAVFSSVGSALVAPSFIAFIAESSSEANRGKVFGISEGLFSIVGVVGPTLAGWLAGSFGYKRMLLVGAILYFMATIIRIVLARRAARTGSGRDARPERLSFTGLKANLGAMLGLILSGGIVAWIMVTDGISDTSFALSGPLFSLFMKDIGGLTLAQVGIISSTFYIFYLMATFAGGWLSDKAGERVGIALGFALIGLSLVLFVNVRSTWLFMLSRAIAGTGAGFIGPAYQSLISKAVPEKIRGTAYGLFGTSLGIISLPAPWIGAQLWEKVSPSFPILLTACACGLATIPVLLKFKLPKGNGSEEVQVETNTG
jgi:MFS family permease